MSDEITKKLLTSSELWTLLKDKGLLTKIPENPKVTDEAPEEAVVTITATDSANEWAKSVTVHIDTEPTVSEEEEAELTEPKPTCRFFAPSDSAVKELGAEAPSSWPFNRMMFFHACMCPAQNAKGKQACEIPDNQSACYYYQESTPVSLITKRLTPKAVGNQRRLSLRKNGYEYGVPVYFVVSNDANPDGIFSDETEQVVHVVSALDHKEKAHEVAELLYNEELKTFNASKATDEVVKVDVTPPSYLREKVTCLLK